MKHIDNYRLGMTTLKEAIEREFEDCQYQDHWLKDVLVELLSKEEYSTAWKYINDLMREKSFNRIFKK